jgi:hypothetical protein
VRVRVPRRDWPIPKELYEFNTALRARYADRRFFTDSLDQATVLVHKDVVRAVQWVENFVYSFYGGHGDFLPEPEEQTTPFQDAIAKAHQASRPIGQKRKYDKENEARRVKRRPNNAFPDLDGLS